MVKLSDFWKRGKNAASVQTARPAAFGFNETMPLYARDGAVYDGLRHSIPIIDAAIDKIGRLVGGCVPVCEDASAQAELEQFFRQVPVGASSCGMESFVRCYLDSLLTYGSAVGEIVLSADGRTVAGLYNAPLRNLCFQHTDDPFDMQICTLKNGFTPVPAPWPELIVFSALNPRPGEIAGCSLLDSLPFVCNVLKKIYASIGQNFERIANLRYAVTYKPGSSSVDRACAKDIAASMAKEWSEAMSAAKSGVVKDFVAVGDVDIKVIGADNQMIDTQVPVRQMLEQIVAKLGIPPFMLGLNWSTTERMSSQLADMLTSELKSYRRLLDPVLIKICTVFLRLRGYTCPVSIHWNSINLSDELELANARLITLQADQLEHQLKEGEQA